MTINSGKGGRNTRVFWQDVDRKERDLCVALCVALCVVLCASVRTWIVTGLFLALISFQDFSREEIELCVA